MKNMLPSAFGYVEGSGWYYGVNGNYKYIEFGK
jgi:hypothetical protein